MWDLDNLIRKSVTAFFLLKENLFFYSANIDLIVQTLKRCTGFSMPDVTLSVS